MPRKYQGPLQKGKRSAYVKGSRKNKYKKSIDAKQNKEIKQIKKQVKSILKTIDVKKCVQKFATTTADYTTVWCPDVRLYEFPTSSTIQDVKYAPTLELIDARESNRINVLRTKIHLNFNDCLPGAQIRVMLINVLDTGLDVTSPLQMQERAGMFLRYANWNDNGDYLTNRDNPSMIVHSPYKNEDPHLFKVYHDQIITVNNYPIVHTTDTNQVYYAKKTCRININHKKKKKTPDGLQLEFGESLEVSNKNRLFLMVYTDQTSLFPMHISGYCEQFFTEEK